MEYIIFVGGLYGTKYIYDYFYPGTNFASSPGKKELCQEIQNYNRAKLKPAQKNNNQLSMNNELREILNKKFKNVTLD
jgi:hypothetical protein